jgi:hypothetical protein
MKNNEMGGACNTHGSRRGAYRVLVGRHEGKNHLENLGVDGEKYLNGSARTGI